MKPVLSCEAAAQSACALASSRGRQQGPPEDWANPRGNRVSARHASPPGVVTTEPSPGHMAPLSGG